MAVVVVSGADRFRVTARVPLAGAPARALAELTKAFLGDVVSATGACIAGREIIVSDGSGWRPFVDARSLLPGAVVRVL